MARPVGYGRPDTKVFPDGWQAAGAAVVADTYDCTISIGPAGTAPAWDDAAGATLSGAAATVYVGPASITPSSEDGQESAVAEDVVPTRSYEVKIQHTEADVQVGHVITVTAAPDGALVGERLKVVAVEMGSRRFSRLLIAVDAD